MQRIGYLHLGLPMFAAGKEFEDFQSTIQSRYGYKLLLAIFGFFVHGGHYTIKHVFMRYIGGKKFRKVGYMGRVFMV